MPTTRPNPALLLLSAGVLTALGASVIAGPTPTTLPPVPVPPENPITEPKRILGKILFWDEQLSTDNATSCGTCHIPSAGGTDPRPARNAGFDGVLDTDDDIIGSMGVLDAGADLLWLNDQAFGLTPQVTGRATNSNILAMYAPSLFWDGRAGDQFVDPETGQVLIQQHGALESQAVGPVLSDVEMAHAERDWDQVRQKLTTAVPLTLATDLPADVASALANEPSYPDLFQDAFGDPAINAARIAFALATYQRTLIPDQTPWDLFQLGDPDAMTGFALQGWGLFQESRCDLCHIPPLFTDNTFRNIAVRPTREDAGQSRGRFKTPTLRGVGLKPTMMHNGMFTDMGDVFDLYSRLVGPSDRDSILPVIVPASEQSFITRFINDALTDPRVANETFPFDRPTLNSERPETHFTLIGDGVRGTQGTPDFEALSPPNIGNADFQVGVTNAYGGRPAELHISFSPPFGDEIVPDEIIGPMTLTGAFARQGFASALWPIPADPALDGETVYMQWVIDDPNFPTRPARTRVAAFTLFCGRACPSAVETCPSDIDNDGDADIQDVLQFLALWFQDDGDMNNDGATTITDLLIFLDGYIAGC